MSGDAHSGFDAHARRYGLCWDGDPVAKLQREVVHEVISDWVGPDRRALDIGCGTGTDAGWMHARGTEVVGVDASPGMVHEARSRFPDVEFRELAAEQVDSLAELPAFDLALMDFGVINMTQPERVAHGLARCVREGGRLVVVTMPRLHPTWLVREILRGRLRGAWSRLKEIAEVPVEGESVRVQYQSSRKLASAFEPWFELDHQRGLGFFLPPPGSRLGERWAQVLDRLEKPLRGIPGFSSVGDHVVLVFRRRASTDRRMRWSRLDTRRARLTGRVRSVHTLVLEATTGCQSSCTTCSYRGPAGGEAMTPQVARGLVEEAALLGARSVVVTGGEPLLRTDRDSFLREVSAVGLPVSLLTNGLTLARDAQLVADTCQEVILSLDGFDSASYRKARGVDGFEAVCSGVIALKRLAPEIPVRARVTVSASNAGVLDRIVETAVAMELTSISFLAVDRDSGDAFGRSSRAELEQASAAEVASSLERAQRIAPSGFIVDSAIALQRVHRKLSADAGEATLDAPRCNAPWTSVFVQSDLKMRPCFFQPAYGDAEWGLSAGLRQGRRALQALDVRSDPTCQRCVCWAELR